MLLGSMYVTDRLVFDSVNFSTFNALTLCFVDAQSVETTNGPMTGLSKCTVCTVHEGSSAKIAVHRVLAS